MKTTTRNRVKKFVKDTTGCTHVESTTISMMLEVKTSLNEDDIKASIEALLALVIRQSKIPAVHDTDDLSKLLNSTVDVRVDTGPLSLRGLIKEQM